MSGITKITLEHCLLDDKLLYQSGRNSKIPLSLILSGLSRKVSLKLKLARGWRMVCEGGNHD